MVFYDEIVEIMFDWEPTNQQKTIVGEKLNSI